MKLRLASVLALGSFCGAACTDSSSEGNSSSTTDASATDSPAETGEETTASATTDTSGGADGSSSSAGSTGPLDEGVFERGLILPPNSLPCTPVSTGVPQMECNHHGSTIAELATGEIATVWYHGEAEKSPDVNIVWSRITPGQTEWSAPEELFDDPERSEGNPAIWVSEDGEILVFFVSIYGDGWAETKVRLVRSSDNGESFSEPQLLRDDLCWNTRQKPLRLDNGDLLLPLYLECLGLPVFMTSSDDFREDVRWTEFGDMPDGQEYFAAHAGQIQPSIAFRDDGTLSAITRNGLGTGHIKEMIGDPAGETWSMSEDIGLPNSGTSVDQVRLANGHRVVIFNNSPEVRFPLAAALSVDDGATFTAVRNLVDACDDGVDECEFHYPSVTQASDGTIWVSYTHDRASIGWVHFDEQWLSAGGDEAVLP